MKITLSKNHILLKKENNVDEKNYKIKINNLINNLVILVYLYF